MYRIHEGIKIEVTGIGIQNNTMIICNSITSKYVFHYF